MSAASHARVLVRQVALKELSDYKLTRGQMTEEPTGCLGKRVRDLYNNGTLGHSQSAAKVQVEIQANGSAQAVGRASAVIVTRGCNLCRVKYATYFATGGTGLAAINGQTLENTNGVIQEAYVSVTGSSWELFFDAKDNDTYGSNYMFITEILMTHSS